ncbi:YaaL family protein [Weissella diestrammenae]|uniref:YaaL family protein n=1 Tax=Weissella diestrammenae TaxID=1162633 RepID=A0A7G9T3I9_9LACO|nr:YaaL family protein [Weissella diestrammenae]MCM0582635.1 YaaL family protein [Weissella diestrammenae]QNN74664.1 YaaL family protein [Weissella diestrammenae]
MFNLSKRSKWDSTVFDHQLIDAIDNAKYDYEKAKMSEEALFESNIDPRLIKAQTAFAKQKYFFLLRASRERQMKGHWQNVFMRPE